MSYKVGDKVAVLDDVIKGKITAINSDVITIESEDGFEFDFSSKELVVIKENQSELSKYSDIKNEDLLHKTDEKIKRKVVVKKSKEDKIPPMEVDLHINQLIDSTRGMDNFDILTIQLDTAKHKLEFAIRNRIRRVVFIHGVGEGVLKTELEYLFNKYHVDFYDAPYQKYGLGATEVYIFQNKNN